MYQHTSKEYSGLFESWTEGLAPRPNRSRQGKVGNRIKSIASKRSTGWPTTDTPATCLLATSQVVYAGSGERVSYTDAVLPFASLIGRILTTASSRTYTPFDHANPIYHRIGLQTRLRLLGNSTLLLIFVDDSHESHFQRRFLRHGTTGG